MISNVVESVVMETYFCHQGECIFHINCKGRTGLNWIYILIVLLLKNYHTNTIQKHYTLYSIHTLENPTADLDNLESDLYYNLKDCISKVLLRTQRQSKDLTIF